MATRPELHEAVAGQKSKASEYNDNFSQLMDFVDNSIDEAKDYVEGFMPAISASTSGKLLTNDGSDASWVNFINNKPFANIIDGLFVTKAGSSTIEVTAGSCYDANNEIVLALGNDTTKTKDNQAPLTTYYVYIVGNGSSVDILIDISSSAPTMPTGYSYKKLLCSYFTGETNKIEKITYYNSVAGRSLTEVYSNEDSQLYYTWYRLYSDGWCEQGGKTTSNGRTSTSVWLGKNLKNIRGVSIVDEDYPGQLFACSVKPEYTQGQAGISGLTIYTNGNSKSLPKYWYVCGYTY